jgi:hypothetical protein
MQCSLLWNAWEEGLESAVTTRTTLGDTVYQQTKGVPFFAPPRISGLCSMPDVWSATLNADTILEVALVCGVHSAKGGVQDSD